MVVIFTLVPAVFGTAQQVQEGNATWYETNDADLSARHSRLPLGIHLKVTSLENNKEVYVTINGRIPSSPDQILDISQEAARQLEMLDSDSMQIRYEVVREIPLPPELVAAEPEAPEEYEADAIPEIAVILVSQEDEEDEYEDMAPPVYVSQSQAEPQPPVRTTVPPAQAAAAPPQRESAPVPPVQSGPAPSTEPIFIRTESGALTLIINVGNGQEYNIEIPLSGEASALPAPPPSPQPAPPPPPPPVVLPANRGETAVPLHPIVPPVGGRAAKIIPKMPDSRGNKVYRVQVGAFSVTNIAQECFNRLKSAGFSPAFERYGSLYRVVITGIKAADMPQAAQRLGSAGFTEVWVREES